MTLLPPGHHRDRCVMYRRHRLSTALAAVTPMTHALRKHPGRGSTFRAPTLSRLRQAERKPLDAIVKPFPLSPSSASSYVPSPRAVEMVPPHRVLHLRRFRDRSEAASSGSLARTLDGFDSLRVFEEPVALSGTVPRGAEVGFDGSVTHTPTAFSLVRVNPLAVST
ncbi:hypothetical protein BC834DRAFT_46859 [Gloeopeniophorella convolvens]|nr:hypothetical protein BC834DRAFT_46859 [Gloeopeniophorella convolvens]